MKHFVVSTTFEKDLKRMSKRGKDISKLQKFLDKLQHGEAIAPKYKVHRLSGVWNDFLDAHLEPDWIVIFNVDKTTINLARTGTHSDLF